MSARSRFEHRLKVLRRIRKMECPKNKPGFNNLTDQEKQKEMLKWSKFVRDVQ